MILKTELQSIISKYYLNSLVESVKWSIKDNKLVIKFSSPNRTMLGVVTYSNIDLEDSLIGVSNTSQLNKLLSITRGHLELKYKKEKSHLTKLIISDNQFTLSYTLADTMIIPKTGEYIGDGVFNIKATIDNECITAITKAKSALAETDTVVIKPFIDSDLQSKLELVFGGDIEYSNKISYYIPNIELNNTPPNFTLNYDSNILKDIMSCNNDMENGLLEINLDGIMKLQFSKENITSEYFLVAKDN
jgi:hypothetical protein